MNSTSNKSKLVEIFKEIDMNQDGFICRIELTQLFLRNGYSQEEVNAIMIASDENNDGKICIEEFKRNFEFF